MGIGIEELRKCGTALPIDYAGRVELAVYASSWYIY